MSQQQQQIKRKNSESFLREPESKAKIFSLDSKRINHCHTNSLPVDTNLLPNKTTTKKNDKKFDSIRSPAKNLIEKLKIGSSSLPLSLPPISNNDSISNIDIPLNEIKQEPTRTGPNHVKTYSLPVVFNDPSTSHHQQQQNNNPLPPNWTMERTPTGQIYFINHLTRITTWIDPRQTANCSQEMFPHRNMNNNIQSIPLPNGWEESRTETGQSYFINHNTKVTTWEDPRINLYIEQRNFSSNSTVSTTSSSSVSSLSSPVIRDTVHTSLNSLSNSSLDDVHSNPTSNSYQKMPTQTYNGDLTIEQKVYNLRMNLDQLLKHKFMISSQLDDLNKKVTCLNLNILFYSIQFN
jgi:hypothetical protein